MKTRFTFINRIHEKGLAAFNAVSFSNSRLKKVVATIIFAIAIHFIFSFVGVYAFINKRPCSIHNSAQAQRASVALNYYENDMNFFEPRIQRYVKGEGITGLEFPVIYYTAAVFYKVFGFNEIYLRIIDLFVLLAGIYLFYIASLKYIRGALPAIFILSAAIISPVMLFYGPNFLPDAPSLGLVLCGWYFFLRYIEDKRERSLTWFVVCVTFATLLKVVASIAFVLVIGLIILDRLNFFQKSHGRIFEKPLRLIGKVVLGLSLVVLWYWYARHLSIVNKNMTFALEPVMVNSWESLHAVLDHMKNFWLFQYYSYETYVLLVCAAIFFVITYKLVNRLLFSITILYALGSLFYFFFFTYQFKYHDYYIISALPVSFFALLTFGDILSKLYTRYFSPLVLVLLVIMFFNLKESLLNCKMHYYNRYLYELNLYQGGTDFRPYEDIEPKLRAHGIKRTDKMVSYRDLSYCTSLYLMNQLGINIGDETEPHDLDTLLRMPEIKYLVLNDSTSFNAKYKRNYADRILFIHRGVIVYKLKD